MEDMEYASYMTLNSVFTIMAITSCEVWTSVIEKQCEKKTFYFKNMNLKNMNSAVCVSRYIVRFYSFM